MTRQGARPGIRAPGRTTGATIVCLALAASAVTISGCKLGKGSGDDGASSSAQPASNVVRYAGMETPETGAAQVRQSVRARTAADWTSATVEVLQPGAAVNRVARYGNFTLIAWTGSAGAMQGWVDTGTAFRQIAWDAGVDRGALGPAFADGGSPTAPTTITKPPPAALAPTTTTKPTATTTPGKRSR